MGVLALCFSSSCPPPSPLSFPFLSGLQRWWELTPRRGEPFLKSVLAQPGARHDPGHGRCPENRSMTEQVFPHNVAIYAAGNAEGANHRDHRWPKQLWVEEDDLACLLLEQEVLHGWLLQISRGSGVQDHAFQVRELGRPLELGGELSAVRKVVSDASECSF